MKSWRRVWVPLTEVTTVNLKGMCVCELIKQTREVNVFLKIREGVSVICAESVYFSLKKYESLHILIL